ncbi:transaldolase family protein [Cyanobium sp. WAJ14-Wanaka]|uniref:transaldolase family protein n=1 Tax=Cyanobium sp. WAJ14-Wanaka TaxID=2823725 RepID=UPI0020CEB9F3|nr:transaldolase family protein [Cyanobium sp. WAJ14-Wanaka]MCP9775208.1 transaldolase [Cyanobium sp. WAJ14-Wanaka]
MTLRLLLDSADPKAWRQWLPTGLFHGVTTNPSLLRRAGQSCTTANLAVLSRQAEEFGAQEIHLQAWGANQIAMAECGQALAAMVPGKILVKLPITALGAAVAQQLISQNRIPITFTACYEAPQVLLAAALGAHYIAPYLGRISDQGRDGHREVIGMQRCLDGLGSSLRLLVASLRQKEDLSRLAAEGLTTFTLSPDLAEALFSCQATEAAAAQFEQDAAG